MTDTDARTPPETRPDVDPDVAELLGLSAADAGAIPHMEAMDGTGELTDTKIYEGELEAGTPGSDLREGETDDPGEAAEEGLTWIPPTDPPTVADERGDAVVAAGFGVTADAEPFDADHHAEELYPEDEMEARVHDALRASAETAGLVDRLEIDAEGGRVIIAGTVEDLDDEDAVLAIVESVTGVTGVVSRIEVRAVEEVPIDPRGLPTP